MEKLKKFFYLYLHFGLEKDLSAVTTSVRNNNNAIIFNVVYFSKQIYVYFILQTFYQRYL